MALGIYFVHQGFTPEKYESAHQAARGRRRRRAQGSHLPRRPRVRGSIQVFDIWESQADFEAFGQTLIPILSELGVELKDPMIANVHNVIKRLKPLTQRARERSWQCGSTTWS